MTKTGFKFDSKSGSDAANKSHWLRWWRREHVPSLLLGPAGSAGSAGSDGERKTPVSVDLLIDDVDDWRLAAAPSVQAAVLARESFTAELARDRISAASKLTILRSEQRASAGMVSLDSIRSLHRAAFNSVYEAYDQREGQSIDYAVMEHQARLRAWALDRQAPKLGVVEGTVRSGKTWAGCLSLILHGLVHGRDMVADPIYLLIAPSQGQVWRSIAPVFKRICQYFDWSHTEVRTSGEARIRVEGLTFRVFGGENEGSQTRLAGIEACGGMADEAYAVQPDVLAEALSRCSLPGAKFLLSMMAPAPNSEIVKRYLDNDEIDKVKVFADGRKNPSVDGSVWEDLERQREHSSFAKRSLGIRAADSGLLYPLWRREQRLPASSDYAVILAGIDEGRSDRSPSALILLGYVADEGYWVVFEEWKQPLVPLSAAAQAMAALIPAGATVFTDPSASALANELVKLDISSWPAPNSIVSRDLNAPSSVNETARLLADGYVRIDPDACPMLASELASVTWNKAGTGVDTVDDHLSDALRYAVAGLARNLAEHGEIA